MNQQKLLGLIETAEQNLLDLTNYLEKTPTEMPTVQLNDLQSAIYTLSDKLSDFKTDLKNLGD